MNKTTRKNLETEWARSKYLLMSKSHQAYNQVRGLFKNNQNFNPDQFYLIMEHYLKQAESIKDEVNAFEHVWGYFKKIASSKEKNLYLRMLSAYQMQKISSTEMKSYLYVLAKKYQIEYLLDSYYFYMLKK